MQYAYTRVSFFLSLAYDADILVHRCGGMIGMFFLVKRCSLLYLNAGNGAFLAPPYLDTHGEIDISMRWVLGWPTIMKCVLTYRVRRGRRQFLHPARWEDVRKTWLNHAIPTIVARKLESTIDTGGWETL